MQQPERIMEAYRWQRALGNAVVMLPHGRVVTNVAHPDVWDANHADAITAERPDDIDNLLTDIERSLTHSRWRVVHTDPSTPEPFCARLALDGFAEQPAIIQMVLEQPFRAEPVGDVLAVATQEDWATLAGLVRRDHAEGARTGGRILSADVSAAIVAGYRAKAGVHRFHLAWLDGEAVGYGACAAAPSGAGMIEDLFTLPAFRRRGVASAMIARFAVELEAQNCRCVFLGARVGTQAGRLYAKLGFRPLMLTRSWVRRNL